MFLIASRRSWPSCFVFTEIPALVIQRLFSITDSPSGPAASWSRVVLLIIGILMDPTPAILIFTPIFLPIVVTGINPVHAGS